MLAKHGINFPLQILATTPAVAGSTHTQRRSPSTTSGHQTPATIGGKKKKKHLTSKIDSNV
jgi:hypothetical protein